MKHKFLFGAALALSLSALQAASCFATGFVTTPQGVKYQWGDGNYCYNNWVHVRDHWFYFGNDQLMRTGWIQRDNTWYFAADTGELQAGRGGQGNVGGGDAPLSPFLPTPIYKNATVFPIFRLPRFSYISQARAPLSNQGPIPSQARGANIWIR